VASASTGDTDQPEAERTVNMIFFKVAIIPAGERADEWRDQGDPSSASPASIRPPTSMSRSIHSTAGSTTTSSWGPGSGTKVLAMQYMALGTHLGSFALLSPRTMLPGVDSDRAISMASQGLLAVQKDR